MKTISQIKSKINSLKNKLIKTASSKGIYENFGQSELQQLNNFIGNIYDYDYFTRQKILNLLKSFENFCSNYSIK